MEAKEILDTMLGYLGFVADIHEVETDTGRQLQVFTAESEALIGPEGETLEDLQFLLNRILQAQDRNALRVQVDVGHHQLGWLIISRSFRSYTDSGRIIAGDFRRIERGVRCRGGLP